MTVPAECKYTEDHEWIKKDGASYVIGITEYAQSELGDVVFVDLPEVGKQVAKGDTLLAVESVKAVSDVYAPVAGKVVAVNEALNDSPELINTSSFAEGWMVKLEVNDAGELSTLLDPGAYEAHISAISK